MTEYDELAKHAHETAAIMRSHKAASCEASELDAYGEAITTLWSQLEGAKNLLAAAKLHQNGLDSENAHLREALDAAALEAGAGCKAVGIKSDAYPRFMAISHICLTVNEAALQSDKVGVGDG